MAQKSRKGPNYALIGGLGVVGAAIGGAAGKFALHLGPLETGGLAVGGLLVCAALGLLGSATGDTKRIATQLSVKKNVDLAYQQQSLGRLAEAEKLLLEALERGKELEDNDLNKLSATHSLGNLYRLQNKPEQAEQNYRKALSSYESLKMTEEAVYAQCLRDCALVLEARGQNQDSLEMARRALPLFEKLGQSREVAEVMSLMARNTRALGLLDQAAEAYRKVKDLQIKQFGEYSAEVIDTVLTSARTLRSLNQLPEAIDAYKDVLVRLNKSERPPRSSEAEALLEMAEVSLEQGQLKSVEPLCLGSLKVLQNFVGPREKLIARLAAALRSAREKLNQPLSETEFILLFTQNRDQVRDLFREQPDLAKQKDRAGWSPIQWTLFLGWDDLMRWLIRNGAQADGFEANVMSPVHVASAWSKGGTITFLAENNIALDPVGPQGWSPVHYAAYHGKQDCLEQLLARGSDANRLDVVGRSALHWAADRGHPDMVAFLLGKNLDKDLPDGKYGRSPLHLAAAAGYGLVVRTLMMNGANEQLADKSGKTPIHLAEEAGHRGLVAAMKHFRSAMES
ncbi:MAG: ankyrin repeat domain-containing protein [Candidatus Eremiobacteraeota bacterium]|nr:ankyrin repeat domain-containing protein [Candidatus Eremiobacteraeota bacterium]